MWMLDNKTPYEAERSWVRDTEGVHHWIVVVKATYDITETGTLKQSAKPIVPLHAAEYYGDPGASSIRYEADLAAMKPGTDIYLNAIAYAPKGKPCKKVAVSFRIGQLYKELLVYGERVWRRTIFWGVKPSSSKPFETMPITYERAFGGFDHADPNPKKHRIDFRNPVGTGVAFKKSSLIGKPAPSVVDPNGKMGKGWPAGFGAVAGFWSPRKELTGTYDQKWMEKRQPLLPLDYNPKFLLCSPLDQQVGGYLQGGEQVELMNLTPSGRVRFTLPKESFSFETYFGAKRKEHLSELVSVIVESDRPRLIMVWQTSLRCGNDADYLDKTVIQQKDLRR